MDPAPEESKWRRRARRIAYWMILLQLGGIAVFLATLLLGERSRVTLLALYLPRHPLLAAAIFATALAPFTRRRFLLPVQLVLCLVLLFPVMGFTVSTSRHAEKPIRLASYNVFFGKLGRTQVVDELAAMSADIIVLQAAHGSMGDRLRERFPERTVHQEGELIMVTRFPVRKVEVPPMLPDETPPMFVKYVIDTPQGDLRVYNIHPFSPRHALFDGDETGENIAKREAQIEAAVAAARSDVPPFVIAGDTNLPTLSSMGRRNFAGLKEAFDEVGFGFGYSFPAKHPWMRIDRALASDGVRFVDARVGRRGASDHLPLFVELELEGGR